MPLLRDRLTVQRLACAQMRRARRGREYQLRPATWPYTRLPAKRSLPGRAVALAPVFAVGVLALGGATDAAVSTRAAAGSWTITSLGVRGRAVAISDRGEVIGWTEGQTAATHAFIWRQGRLRRLGKLGEKHSRAVAINARGQVVATIGEEDTGWFAGFWRPSRAFVWQNGVSSLLPTLGGKTGATAINDRGEIVGWSETRNGQTHAVIWQNGRIRDLGTLGGSISEALAINNRGDVVGWSETAARASHAVIWQRGRIHDLGTLGARESEAKAINDSAQVIGVTGAWDSHEAAWLGARVFLWSAGKMRYLPGSTSDAVAINGRGEIIGTRSVRPRGRAISVEHGFLWRNGRLRDLGTLGGDTSHAAGINGSGAIVGGSDTKHASHAFVWQNGRLGDLGLLPGGSSSWATAINNHGQIAGWSASGNNAPQLVLWTFHQR